MLSNMQTSNYGIEAAKRRAKKKQEREAALASQQPKKRKTQSTSQPYIDWYPLENENRTI